MKALYKSGIGNYISVHTRRRERGKEKARRPDSEMKEEEGGAKGAGGEGAREERHRGTDSETGRGRRGATQKHSETERRCGGTEGQ